MDICHLKNAELEPKSRRAPWWHCRAPWWHCQRRLCSLRSFYWTGLVCVPNGCRKSNGCYCTTTRLWRTSGWCCICLHSSKIGGRSQIAQHSQVRMFRCMDTSSTTQMANILVKHWRSGGTFQTKSAGHPLAGLSRERQIEEILVDLWWEQVPNWECRFVHRKQWLFLSENVDDIKMAGKKQNMAYMWKKLMKDVDLEEPTSFLDHVYLGCTQRECNPNEIIIEEYTKMFESRISVGTTAKNTGVEKTSRKDGRMVLRRGRTRSNMRWTLLRVGKQERGAVFQSFRSLPGWPSIQVGRTWISWRIITSLLKCLYLARIGRPVILWSVNKLARGGDVTDDWQDWFQYTHHTNEFRQYCHVDNSAQHCRFGLLQDSDFAGELEDSTSTLWGGLVLSEAEHLSPSVGCARSKLLSRTVLQSLKSFRWMLDGAWMVCPLSTSGMLWLRCHVHRRVPNHQPMGQQETAREITNPSPNRRRNRDVDHLSHVDHITTNAHTSPCESQLYIFWGQRRCDQN